MYSPPPTAPQPYAPTPFISLPPPSPSVSLDTEAKLHTTASERELYASLAELHAILVSLEFLEKAFVKDTISAEAYTPTCQRLLKQWESILSDDGVASAFIEVDEFVARYGVRAAAGVRRVKAGVPATSHGGASARVEEAVEEQQMLAASSGGAASGGGRWKNVSPKQAAEATQNFITVMDALRLHYRAPDELHPLLAPVIASVDAVTKGQEEEFEGRKDIVKWLIRLNQMKAGEEITEEMGREMLWDVERAYNAFIEGLG